jgi:hypothetical protein
MATEAQIRANQENAQKSTGPSSIEGKKKSSMNAVTHGIFFQHRHPSWRGRSLYTKTP